MTRTLLLCCLLCAQVTFAQNGPQLRVENIDFDLASFVLNGQIFLSKNAVFQQKTQDTTYYQLGKTRLAFWPEKAEGTYQKYALRFENNNPKDTLTLENVVPFGASPERTYITGLGKHGLSRTHLFRPGQKPVNVIVPDNAWHLGYADTKTSDGKQFCALTRRITWNTKIQRRRFETILLPGGTTTYYFWLMPYQGEWQEGLRRMFQEHYLFDLEGQTFDETLYQRADLQWIRKTYAMHLIMAWDKDFYDPGTQKYRYEDFLKKAQALYGGDEAIGIWPNWPMLGLDQRNQWDMYRSLPGGLQRLKGLAKLGRAKYNTRFFISYNPWDESTRWVDHHTGMSEMIEAIGADGVVLDTEGKSSPERQAAADKVRSGVIMYSEGMAVPRDMPGIVSGRVHNALYYPPMLNLNKFIRPDFAIFRVAELYLEPIRREYALSMFNGYGTEVNQFRPGRPNWVDDDYRFWGRTLRVLRENSSVFSQKSYVPLWPSSRDSIYINFWPGAEKSIFTLFSLHPAGYKGLLFETPVKAAYHVVDLWNHEEIKVSEKNGQWQIPVDLEAFAQKWLGTNNEGAVGAIAVLPNLLQVERRGDVLSFSAARGQVIRIWSGLPAYDQKPKEYPINAQQIALHKVFDRPEGKFVIQLLENGEILDERVIWVETGLARLVSQKATYFPSKTVLPGMVQIPAGKFRMSVKYGDDFVPNPKEYPQEELQIPAFLMDKNPVTNAQFAQFLTQSKYRPKDTTNFLRHWVGRKIPKGQEQFPVIYVSYEDAQAYARWAGKRLPTEIEWQYAAQTSDLREWPWSKDAPVKREQQVITETLTVSKLQVDSTLCNTGNGKLYPVGAYPKGANPFGLEDLVGCVWQMTNDVYSNGSNQYLIVKGGSYYLPASSWWYVEGGPRELNYTQKLLRVSPGFERNGTVGFRCAR